MYVPTRGDAKSGWKAKHTIQARGPCVVQQKLGASTYKILDPRTKQVYTRSVAHLTPLNPAAARAMLDSVAARAAVASPGKDPDSPIMVEPVIWVAVVDQPGLKALWLMQVASVSDEMVRGQYLVPNGVDLKQARFRLAWVEQHTGLFILHTPRRNEKVAKWTGAVPLAEDFVVATGLKLQKGGRLTVASGEKLSGCTTAMLRASAKDG